MKTTGGVCLNGGESGQMAFKPRADLQNQAIGWLQRDTVPSTVVRGYDLRKPGGHLGNVGLNVGWNLGLFHRGVSQKRAFRIFCRFIWLLLWGQNGQELS